MLFFLSGICFFPVIGSGVDVRNESVIKIDNIDDPYKYINEQVKASVSSLLSIPGPDPSLTVLSLHQILYAYDSTVFCR
jgi:hypothetical protein